MRAASSTRRADKNVQRNGPINESRGESRSQSFKGTKGGATSKSVGDDGGEPLTMGHRNSHGGSSSFLGINQGEGWFFLWQESFH